GTVASGSASVSYTLPAGTAAKTYTILAEYASRATRKFSDSDDSTHTLTVQKAATTTAAASQTATFSSSVQTVSLSAAVTSGAGTVNQGSVTFPVQHASPTRRSSDLGTVASGSASVSYTLPAGTAAKTYTILAE